MSCERGNSKETHLTIKAYSSANHRSVYTDAQAQVTHGLVVHASISVVMAVASLNDDNKSMNKLAHS